MMEPKEHYFRWKISAILLGLCCMMLIYRLFDQGVTHTYLEASEKSSIRHIELLEGLVFTEFSGLSEEQVMSRLRAYAASRSPDSVILRHERETNIIYFEGVRFKFRGGKLIEVL